MATPEHALNPDKAFPPQRAARIFGLSTAVLAGLTIVFSTAFALTDHPFRSAITLGVGIALLGIARGAWPGRPWFSSRSRWLDVGAYFLLGVSVILLAPLVALGA